MSPLVRIPVHLVAHNVKSCSDDARRLLLLGRRSYRFPRDERSEWVMRETETLFGVVVSTDRQVLPVNVPLANTRVDAVRVMPEDEEWADTFAGLSLDGGLPRL